MPIQRLDDEAKEILHTEQKHVAAYAKGSTVLFWLAISLVPFISWITGLASGRVTLWVLLGAILAAVCSILVFEQSKKADLRAERVIRVELKLDQLLRVTNDLSDRAVGQYRGQSHTGVLPLPK